jgi:hypothetical protein
MSTGEPHPLAAQQMIQPVLSNQTESPFVRCSARVFGQHLAIMFMSSRGGAVFHRFTVWNWKTGGVEMVSTRLLIRATTDVRSLKTINDRDMEAFTFVNERYVMLASLHHKGRPSASIDIHDILATSETPLLTLHYPTLHQASFPLDLRIASDPSPDKAPGPHLDVPFFTSQEDRLFVFTLRAMPLIAEGTELETFHMASSLLLFSLLYFECLNVFLYSFCLYNEYLHFYLRMVHLRSSHGMIGVPRIPEWCRRAMRPIHGSALSSVYDLCTHGAFQAQDPRLKYTTSMARPCVPSQKMKTHAPTHARLAHRPHCYPGLARQWCARPRRLS